MITTSSSVRIGNDPEIDMQEALDYRVARNFCGSLSLRNGNFLRFAGTNFCHWDRLVFLLGINFCDFQTCYPPDHRARLHY